MTAVVGYNSRKRKIKKPCWNYISPLLVSLYLNDIEEQFRRYWRRYVLIFILLYADGIVIFANTEEQLQTSSDLLSEYCKKWKLTINVSKT